MNIKIQGIVTKIYPTEDFTWQGTTYHNATVIVDTPAYQRFDPVAVKIDAEKTPIKFKEGDNVDFECNLDYIEELFEEDSTRKIVLYVMVATLFAAIITTNIFIFIQGNAGD